jgi:hypothetical protein
MIEGIEYKKPYKHNDETKQRKYSLASLTDIIETRKYLLHGAISFCRVITPIRLID